MDLSAFGWLGFGLIFLVPVFQLVQILKTKTVDGISVLTYIALCLSVVCCLIYAGSISNTVFISRYSWELAANLAVLYLLFKYRKRGEKKDV